MDSLVTTPTSTLFNIGELHIELSSRCVLKCPRCPRTELKNDLHPSLNLDYSVSQFRSSFPPDVLAQVERIVFCGDKGDPIYAIDFLEIVEYIKQSNPALGLTIVTNGSYKKPDWWARLGNALNEYDRVTFSVDGWNQQTNSMYRVNCDYDSILDGIRVLVASKTTDTRALISWSMIEFKFNESNKHRIEEVARLTGCDEFTIVTSTKFGSIDQRYLDENGIDYLEPDTINDAINLKIYRKKKMLLTTKRQQNVNTMHEVRVNAVHRAKPQDRSTTGWQKCIGKTRVQVPFISVEGLFYPCAWFDSGYIPNSFVIKHRDKLNVRTRNINDIIADPIWEELETTWALMPLEICKLKCYNA